MKLKLLILFVVLFGSSIIYAIYALPVDYAKQVSLLPGYRLTPHPAILTGTLSSKSSLPLTVTLLFAVYNHGRGLGEFYTIVEPIHVPANGNKAFKISVLPDQFTNADSVTIEKIEAVPTRSN